MADTVSSSIDLKIIWNFADGDTRTLTLPNANEDVTAEQVQEVGTYAVTNQPIIGDKAGAALSGIGSAKIVETSKIDLDLSL